MEWVELDLAAGVGIERAVADVDVIVHAATASQGDTAAVDVDGTERLVATAADAGVSNFVYPSIVGVDAIPYSYYEHKLAAESIVADGPVAHTIVRATQFHEFVAELLGTIIRLPVWPLPTDFRIQPIAAAEAAERIVELATPTAAGRVDPVGGPEVLTVGEIADTYRRVRGLRRLAVRLPLPGAVARAFREGRAACPNRTVGQTTWDTWLRDRYGPGTDAAPAGHSHGGTASSPSEESE